MTKDNIPETWPALIYKIRFLLLWVIIFVSVCFTILFFIYMETVRDILTRNNQALDAVQMAQVKPKPEINFASFKSELPKTDRGYPFNLFTDSAFRGRSTIKFTNRLRTNQKDHYLEIDFNLNRENSQVYDAYAGIYAEWSPPPGMNVDISEYNGVTFIGRLTLNGGDIKGIKLYLSIANDVIRDYAYHEYEFTKQLVNNEERQFLEIRVPFQELKTPSYSYDKREFSPKSVFRISFIIKGNDQAGLLDIDEIKFY